MDKLLSPLQRSPYILFAILATGSLASAAHAAPLPIIEVPVYTAPPAAKPLSPIVPAKHWAYAALDKMVALDSNTCSIFSRPKTQLYTRYEFSVAIARLLDHNSASFGHHFDESIREAEIRDIMAFLKCEFAPELTKLQARTSLAGSLR